MSYILVLLLISELIDITLIHLYKTITLVILYYNFILHPSTYVLFYLLCLTPFTNPHLYVYHLPYQMCLDPELIVVSSKCHNVFLYYYILLFSLLLFSSIPQITYRCQFMTSPKYGRKWTTCFFLRKVKISEENYCVM